MSSSAEGLAPLVALKRRIAIRYRSSADEIEAEGRDPETVTAWRAWARYHDAEADVIATRGRWDHRLRRYWYHRQARRLEERTTE